jgi:hypothetical protein
MWTSPAQGEGTVVATPEAICANGFPAARREIRMTACEMDVLCINTIRTLAIAGRWLGAYFNRPGLDVVD